MTCAHQHRLYWYPSLGCVNEEGWRCVYCDVRPGEPPGYSPQHDREQLHVKVDCVLQGLMMANIVSVANCSEGESIVAAVTRTIETSGNRDQWSIVLATLNVLTPSHAAYWRKHGDAIRAGKDERHRCACGELATVSSGAARWCSPCASKEPLW